MFRGLKKVGAALALGQLGQYGGITTGDCFLMAKVEQERVERKEMFQQHHQKYQNQKQVPCSGPGCENEKQPRKAHKQKTAKGAESANTMAILDPLKLASKKFTVIGGIVVVGLIIFIGFGYNGKLGAVHLQSCYDKTFGLLCKKGTAQSVGGGPQPNSFLDIV